MVALMLVSIATAVVIAAAIVAVRRSRGRRPCSHPLRRARGRTRDPNRSPDLALARAVATTFTHQTRA